MFSITHNTKSNSIEVSDTTKNTYGKIMLNDGGSLQELALGNCRLIESSETLPYNTSYASPILFPFANRVKDGRYNFNGVNYQLGINQKEENNALHGIIYNKTFSVKDYSTRSNAVEVILQYNSTELEVGFPFRYSIQIVYRFDKSVLSIDVTVKNNDDKSFPFTIGWHPYFSSASLKHSKLFFKSNQRIKIGHRSIAEDIEDVDESAIELHNRFDDCWLLEDRKVELKTPNYHIELTSSEPKSFIQVYTPPKPNIVAIEPTTGVSNSFNNKIGLKELHPKESYDITWTLRVISKLQHEKVINKSCKKAF